MSGRRISILITTILLTLGVSSPLTADPLTPDDGPGIITCTAAGLINVVDGAESSTWGISGVGSCQGDRAGPWQLLLSGAGTSSSLGLCDSDPSLLVTNLNLGVQVGLFPVLGGPARLLSQNWFSPVTTYPLTTPFLIAGEGELGAGTMSSRIFLNCPAAGSPVAQFTFAFYDN